MNLIKYLFKVFGTPETGKKKEDAKASAGRKRKGGAATGATPKSKREKKNTSPPRPISHPRFKGKGASDHQVRI